MWRTTLRRLLSHKLRMALSALAIVLGVAFIAGTLVFTATLSKTFGDLFAATSADVNVAPKAAFDVGLTGTGGPDGAASVEQSVVDTIGAVPGVAAVSGDVQAQGVYVLGRDGKVLDTKGVGWNLEPTLNPAKLIDGRAPARDGEVALDNATAVKTGYRIGDTVPLLAPGPRVDAQTVSDREGSIRTASRCSQSGGRASGDGVTLAA